MKKIDEVNELLNSNGFEILIGTHIQNQHDKRFGERKITFIDKKGVLAPIEYSFQTETLNVDNWLSSIQSNKEREINKMKSGGYRNVFYIDRLEDLVIGVQKMKRIKKINELFEGI